MQCHYTTHTPAADHPLTRCPEAATFGVFTGTEDDASQAVYCAEHARTVMDTLHVSGTSFASLALTRADTYADTEPPC